MRYQCKCQRMVWPGYEAVESNWRRKKRCSICGSRPVKNINIAKKISPSGNWTRVTRVTGRYTNHYTNEDRYDRTPCHLTHTICTPPLTTTHWQQIHVTALLLCVGLSPYIMADTYHSASRYIYSHWYMYHWNQSSFHTLVIVPSHTCCTFTLTVFVQFTCNVDGIQEQLTWQWHGVLCHTRWPCQSRYISNSMVMLQTLCYSWIHGLVTESIWFTDAI